MSAGTRPCNRQILVGRLRKAEQFFDAAKTIRELADDEAEAGDAYVTLCIHAGIAAADVVCCAELGHHAQGDDHNSAVTLIRQIVPDGRALGRCLGTLLSLKTRAGYGDRPIGAAERKRAWRAADRLLRVARDRRGGSR